MNLSEIIIDEKYTGLNPVQLGQEHCASKHSYGPAIRTHWLLHYVVSGCGIFEKEGKKYSINAGDMFIIAPFEETYYEADEENPWHYIWIGFTAKELPLPLDTAVMHTPFLEKVFYDALSCRGMNRGKSAFLSAKLWEIFAFLLEQENMQADYIDRAISCMRLEYANGITVTDIANRLNLNRSYFYTLFKERTGTSPQDYLMTLRIEKAIELMLNHGKSPSIAAASTGYSDLYNFSRMFKRHTGLSPREYIKQEKNNRA